MRRRFRADQRRGLVGFNATPMIDVIFLLTIFFMLVTRFSSAEQVPMELPSPEKSQAEVARIPEKVIINCRMNVFPAPGEGQVRYSLGPNQPEPLDIIARRLEAMKQQNPQLKVVIRADRRLHYCDVHELMRTVAAEGIEMVNVAAHVDDQGEGP